MDIINHKPKNIVRGRSSKKNKLLLSKSMTAVFKCTPFHDGICNIVGQYCGTDIPNYQVGDVYMGSSTFMHRDRHLVVVKTVRGNGMRTLECRRYYTYKIIRRTACMVKVQRVARYTAFLSWRTNRWVRKIEFKPEDVIGLTIQDYSYWQPTRMKPYFFEDMAELTTLKATHVVHEIEREGDVDYDQQADKLDVEYGREKARARAVMDRRWLNRF